MIRRANAPWTASLAGYPARRDLFSSQPAPGRITVTQATGALVTSSPGARSEHVKRRVGAGRLGSRSLLAVQAPVRMRGHAQDVHGLGLDLHHEQDMQALQQHGVDVQEVTGQDAGCPGGQELPSGRPPPPRRGVRQRPGSGGSLPADPVPQARQLTVKPAKDSASPIAAPARTPRRGPAVVGAYSGRSISS